VSNILKDEEQFDLILSEHSVGVKTKEAGAILGSVLENGLRVLGKWLNLREITTGELDTFPEPIKLQDPQYDDIYPFPPCYIGYSVDPHSRFDAHSSSLFLSS
jgi:hypothetical protein